MTIKEIIKNTKEFDPNIEGIKVAIQNQSQLTFMGNPTEIYFGELAHVPQNYLESEIIKTSQICASSNDERIGAHVLLITMYLYI